MSLLRMPRGYLIRSLSFQIVSNEILLTQFRGARGVNGNKYQTLKLTLLGNIVSNELKYDKKLFPTGFNH